MLTNLPAYLANSRKAVAQLATLVVTVGTLLLTFQSSLPDGYAAAITTLVAAAGSIVHYATGNAPAPGTVEADDDGVYDITTLTDAAGNEIPNDDPDLDDLDDGPLVSEPAVVPSTGRHATQAVAASSSDTSQG